MMVTFPFFLPASPLQSTLAYAFLSWLMFFALLGDSFGFNRTMCITNWIGALNRKLVLLLLHTQLKGRPTPLS